MTSSTPRRSPQDERFYFLFHQLAMKGVQAAQRFGCLMDDYDSLPDAVAEVRKIEGEADVLVHELEARLHAAMVTPLDREDIHDLTGRLDDVVDQIEATTDRLLLFRVLAPSPHLRQLNDALNRAVLEVEASVQAMMRNDRGTLQDHCRNIHKIENEADQITRDALHYLFSGEVEALEVIKWKEIYDNLEDAIDSCEKAAVIIISSIMKSSS